MIICTLLLSLWGGDSSVVRAPDSWLKGRGFESPQERRENFLLQGWLSVLTDSYFGIRSTPVLPQEHVKDPGHSAKSTGGRLQLNTHTPYVCGFAWCGMVVWCTQNLRRDGCSWACGTSHASAVSTPPRWIFKKRATKKQLVSRVESHASAVSLLKRAESSAT